MTYLVHPQDLVFNSHRINGFIKMVGDENIPQWSLLETALEVCEEWTSDWSEDEGFGSSDMTYMIKDFIDNVICKYTQGGKLMTKFTPSLSIVEYSEAGHHNQVQRTESGC
jgi:hypothetical protein